MQASRGPQRKGHRSAKARYTRRVVSDFSRVRFLEAPALRLRAWAVLAVLSGFVIAALGACGGSSSETPFPLEPDPHLLKPDPAGSSSYVVLPGKSRAPEPEPAEAEPLPEQPTWGGSKTKDEPKPEPVEAE
jgi:hypothetical protein